MKVYILTEGGAGIGLGHVMRCCALYQGFAAHGADPVLVIQKEEDFSGTEAESLAEILSGIQHRMMHWREAEAGILERIARDSIVVVDSYLADASVYRTISRRAGLLVSLDDTLRLPYPDGIVLNSAIKANDLSYPRAENLHYLLGIKYALLRSAFRFPLPRKVSPQIRSVLLTVGGGDPHDMTPGIMSGLQEMFPALELNVVVGGAFSAGQRAAIKRVKGKNTVLCDRPDGAEMAGLMLEADAAVTGGGQTLLELAAAGTPALVMALADNQLDNITGMQEVGTAEFVGWYNDPALMENIKRGLLRLGERQVRQTMSEQGRKCVDGQGGSRAVREILDDYARRQNL